MRVTVVIPALNEAGNIRRLVGEIATDGVESVDIIVVDNGSTDNTAEEAVAAGTRVIHEPRRGYGYACSAGVVASGITEGQTEGRTDIVVFLDGDGSFDPAEMPGLLRPILENRADLVLGTRMAGIEPGAMPLHQRWGNQLVSRLMYWLYRINITDLGPYRAIRSDLLRSLSMREMTFGYPTEMIVKAARHHARIVEVPVTYRRRWSGKSKVSGTIRGTLLATYYILGVTLRYAAPNRKEVP
jgi:glycosyltransferase involved in cell wall biosynthesis